MPRPAAHPSLADQHAAPGGTAAVDRALSLLAVFRAGDGPLGLAELAQRTALHKSTALRLLASLLQAGLLQRLADGRYTLGPELARLHQLYRQQTSLETQLMPVLQALVARTRESAAFHVRQGTQRLCLLRVDSPQLLRDHVRAGDLLPLERGAGGRLLLAFGDPPATGHLAAQARRDGYLLLTGDRVEGLTGLSAPVWQADGTLAGALTLTWPEQRLQHEFIPALREAAQQATRALGGAAPG